MSEINYPVDAATLPQGSCPSTYQELADLFATIYSITVSTTNTGIIVSETKPVDTTAVWKRVVNNGGSLYPTQDYIYVAGIWVSRHTLEPGSIIMWGNALPDFTTFDGGDGGALSIISGPMWSEVTELQARFPIGVGTLPSGTALALGATGGEETHLLTTAEMPPHTHSLTDAAVVRGNINLDVGGVDSGATNTPLTVTGETGGSGSPAVTSPHNNMPPYYTVYWLKRTIKQYFVVP